MPFYRLVLGILAVWRVTHLLQGEDGPGRLIVRLRRRAGSGVWGDMLDCFYCLSVWVATGFALLIGEDTKERLLLPAALSGGAILLERVMSNEPVVAQTLYEEDEEVGHGMLRRD